MEVTSQREWTEFTKRIRIRKSIQELWDCWVSCDLLEQWFLKTAIIVDDNSRRVVRDGDKVEWRWHNYENPSVIEILKIDEPNYMLLDFGSGMKVEIQLKELDGIGELVLRQYDIPTDEESKRNFYLGCSVGWSGWMINLKAYSEYGILLNDKDLGMKPYLFEYVNT